MDDSDRERSTLWGMNLKSLVEVMQGMCTQVAGEGA